MRIDTHAHAFPSIEYMARSLPSPIRLGLSASTALMGTITSAAIAKPGRVTVNSLARLRSGGPKPWHKALEMGAGVAMLPALLSRSGIDDLFASMDHHGIDRTVVIAAWPSAPNEWLLEQAAASDGRIIPVAHPPQPIAHHKEACIRACEDLVAAGARGFKIHHNMDGLPIDAPVYRAMFEVARTHDLFVIVHTGCFNVVGYKHQRPSTPQLFAPLFREFPEVRVCLAHMNRDHAADAWALMKQYQQLFADTSWQPAAVIRLAIDTVGADRIVFGSDWPLLHSNLQGDCASQIETAATAAEAECIFHSAPLALLGL